jgi:hypothetical protein
MKSFYNEYLVKADFADKFGNYKLSDRYYNRALRFAAKPPALPAIFKRLLTDASGNLISFKNISEIKTALKAGFKDPTTSILDARTLEDALKAMGKDDTYATTMTSKYYAQATPALKEKFLDDLIDDMATELSAQFNNPKLYQKIIDWLKVPGNKKKAGIGTGIGAAGTGSIAGLIKLTEGKSDDEVNAALNKIGEKPDDSQSGTQSAPSGTPSAPSGGPSGTGRIKVDPDRYKGPGGMYRERMDLDQQQAKNQEALDFINDNKNNKQLKFQRDWRNKAILFYAKKTGKSFDDKEVLNFANDVSALIKKDMPSLLKEAPVTKVTTPDEFEVPAPTEDKNPADTNNEPKINV